MATTYNQNYTGAILFPEWGKNIPFLFYMLKFQMNDSIHSSSYCYLMNCQLNIQYSNHGQQVAHKQIFFRETGCGGVNNYSIVVPTVVDFEDPAGQWHRESFAIERLNVSCVKQDEDQGFYTIGEISAMRLSSLAYFFIFLSLILILSSLVFAVYSKYGLLVTLISFVFVFLTYILLAIQGFTNTLWIERLYNNLLLILGIIVFAIAFMDYVFNENEELVIEKAKKL